MKATDAELLRQYADEGSQEAFALLVGRYLDLVYSAARRQVRSPQVAEDVAQSVFIKLSASVRQLKPGTPLIAWLYLVTRHTAIKALRQEARRVAREHSAFELSAMNSIPSAWSRIEPLLDEAMEHLPEAERSVVLLRYFDNKSLREVGAIVGISEEAAQKRVSRAVEELRQFLARRGVAVTAAGLASGLSAEAIQAAPPSLGATIVSVAGLSGLHQATLAAVTLTMTTLQKTLVATALAALLGAGWYESRVATRQKEQLSELQDRSDELAAQTRRAQQDRAEALARLGRLNDPAPAPIAAAGEAALAGNSSLQSAAATLVAKAQRVRQLFDERPERKIPELQLFSDEDWVKALTRVGELDTEAHIRAALTRLRFAAKVNLAVVIGRAVADYKQANGGASPPDLEALTAAINSPLAAAILPRYTVEPPSAGRPSWRLLEKESALVDDDYDNRYLLLENGFTLAGLSKSETAFQAAITQYSAANNGDRPATGAQLQPFLGSPVDPARIQELLDELLNPGMAGGMAVATPKP